MPGPSELAAVRASLSGAQQRIERATRQLELATELEARLRALLLAPSLPEVLVPASPARQSAELEATGILLKAELRAAEILSAPGGSGTATIGSDAARALEHHLLALADVEEGLVELGRRALQLEEGRGTGAPARSVDAGPAQGGARPTGGVVPVPPARRPRQGEPE